VYSSATFKVEECRQGDNGSESSGDIRRLGRAAWLWTPVFWWEYQNFPLWVVAKVKELLSSALGIGSTQSVLAGETTLT